jgi:uncharacterized protein (AIM24 family)
MAGEYVTEILRKAKSLFDGEQPAEAVAALEEALKADPRDVRVLSFLAYLSYRLGDLDKSRDTYRRLTGLDPDNLSVWSNLGIIQFKLGLFEEARVAFEEYLDRSPDDARVLTWMARVLERMGRANAARGYHLRAASLTGEPVAPEADAGREVEAAAVSPAPPKDSAPAAGVPGDDDDDDAVPLEEWVEGFGGYPVGAVRRSRSLSPRFVSLRIEERVHFSLTSLVMYRGIVVIGQGVNPYGKIPRSRRSDSLVLMSAEGNGHLWLYHPAGGLVTLELEDAVMTVNAHRLVAFEAGLEPEWLPLGKEGHLPGMTALHLSGTGRLVIAAGDGPAAARLTSGGPLFFRPPAVLAWTGGEDPETDQGDDLKKVREFFDGPFLRFEGTGRVFICG